MNRQTDTSENITFTKFRWWAVNHASVCNISADDDDIFQCGKCKKQFPISAYIAHKQTRCTPTAGAGVAGGGAGVVGVIAQRPAGATHTNLNPSPNSAFTATSSTAILKQVSITNIRLQ